MFADVYIRWAENRKPFAEEWVAQPAGRWDQAVAGSSALRVALFRAFVGECVGVSVGFAVGSFEGV